MPTISKSEQAARDKDAVSILTQEYRTAQARLADLQARRVDPQAIKSAQEDVASSAREIVRMGGSVPINSNTVKSNANVVPTVTAPSGLVTPTSTGTPWYNTIFSMDPGSTGEALVRGATQGATLGLGNKIQAAARALNASKTDAEFVKNYEQYRNEGDISNANAEKAHPVAYIGSQVASSLPGAMVAGTGTVLPQIAKSLALGATQGAGKTAKSTGDVALNTTLGGAVGAVGGAVGAGLNKIADIGATNVAKKIAEIKKPLYAKVGAQEATLHDALTAVRNGEASTAQISQVQKEVAPDILNQALKHQGDLKIAEQHKNELAYLGKLGVATPEEVRAAEEAYMDLHKANTPIAKILDNQINQSKNWSARLQTEGAKSIPELTANTKENVANAGLLDSSKMLLNPQSDINKAVAGTPEQFAKISSAVGAIPKGILPGWTKTALAIGGGGLGEKAGEYIGGKAAEGLGYNPTYGKVLGGALGAGLGGFGLSHLGIPTLTQTVPLAFPNAVRAINAVPNIVGLNTVQGALPTPVELTPEEQTAERDIFGSNQNTARPVQPSDQFTPDEQTAERDIFGSK